MSMSKHQATAASVMSDANVSKQVSRIFSVAPVLKDKVVSELMKENSELKLKIFFYEHNPGQLILATRQANVLHPDHINCGCRSCVLGGRETEMWVNLRDDGTCEFKPWFQDRLEDCGLTFSSPTGDDVERFLANPFHEAVINRDVHLVNCARGDWCEIYYGTRITNAKSVDDPELAKLAELFRLLSPDVDTVESV